MLLVKRVFGLVSVFFLSMLLSGCFDTDRKLLGNYGDRLQIGPQLSCISAEGSMGMWLVTEERSETPPSRYRYTGLQGNTRTTVVAKEVAGDGLYLLQMSTGTGYQYLWYREPTHEIFYFDAEWSPSEELAKKHNVEVTRSMGAFSIKGSSQAMLNYFEEITADVDLLPTQFTCLWTIH